jgi:hypothetical protein
MTLYVTPPVFVASRPCTAAAPASVRALVAARQGCYQALSGAATSTSGAPVVLPGPDARRVVAVVTRGGRGGRVASSLRRHWPATQISDCGVMRFIFFGLDSRMIQLECTQD